MEEQPTRTAEFHVDGMTCQNCARHVREAAEAMPGVSRASVDLSKARLRVRWTEGAVPDAASVTAAVIKAGYPTRPVDSGDTGTGTGRETSAGGGWRLNVVLGGVVTVALMLAEWVLGLGHEPWFGWAAMIAALPVQTLCGARFYRGAWAQIRRGASNMDTLVALGSSAAFGFSVWVVLWGGGGHVFFMESAAIITLISVGHWLEALASERAAGALRSLMRLAPATARRLGDDGREEVIAVGDLMTGERIVLQPGDAIPTDSEVMEGGSAVDESMLTGEAKPVEKVPGSKVFAGTVNADGRLVVRVEAVGETTVLAGIIAAVERAQNSRASIQRLADAVSAVFVPVVIVLAVATGLIWGLAPEQAAAVHAWFGRFLWTMPAMESPLAAGIIHATSVLIVACPCAMGLATPAAIMAGANVAATRGILIRDGVALEKAGRIDTVMFDKTGTLTHGKLKVTEVRDLRPDGERLESLEGLVSAVARGSRHPVAKALAALSQAAPRSDDARRPLAPLPRLPGAAAVSAGAGGPSVLRFGVGEGIAFRPRGTATGGGWTDWREIRGCGVEARRAGDPSTVYRLGSMVWLDENGVREALASPASGADRGSVSTHVGLAAGNRLLGTFELRDTIREEAHGVVAALHRDGFEVYLLSGDGWLAAEAVGKGLGIPSAHVMASLRPEQKAGAIEGLQAQGRRVAFVGDGLNDGPALARADLGIAVSRATDVARESSDVVLMRSGLQGVREALGLSQATLRTIRQNLFWAFFYNGAAVPLAMLGFFTPVVCAAAMGLSDLLVVGNAWRLRYWTLRADPPRPGAGPAARSGAGGSI